MTLIVNVASFWGLTQKNYTQLVELHSMYAARGLRILGFPCNQFGKQVGQVCFSRCALQPFNLSCLWIWEIRHNGCLPFARINRLVRPLNNGKGFSKISKPTERNGAYHVPFDFASLFSADERLENGNSATGKEISTESVPNGQRGLPPEVVYNFRTDFPENYCSIWLATEISGYFAKW